MPKSTAIKTESDDSFDSDDTVKFCTCAVCLYTYTSKRSLVRHVKQSKHYLQVQVPDFIKHMLPIDCEFNLCNYNVESGTFKICLPLLTTKEQLRCWIHKFELINGCKYVRKHGSRVTKSSSFEETYSCQHFRPPSRINRSKGTMCQSKIYAAVKRSTMLMYTMITVHYQHNHQLHTPYVLKFKPEPPERIEIIFENIFDDKIELHHGDDDETNTTTHVFTTAVDDIKVMDEQQQCDGHLIEYEQHNINDVLYLDDVAFKDEPATYNIIEQQQQLQPDEAAEEEQEEADNNYHQQLETAAMVVIDKFEQNLNLFIRQLKNYPDYFADGVNLFNDKIEKLLNRSPEKQLSALFQFARSRRGATSRKSSENYVINNDASNSTSSCCRSSSRSSNSSVSSSITSHNYDSVSSEEDENSKFCRYIDQCDQEDEEEEVNYDALKMDHDYSTTSSLASLVVPLYPPSPTSSDIFIETVGIIDVCSEESAGSNSPQLETLSSSSCYSNYYHHPMTVEYTV